MSAATRRQASHTHKTRKARRKQAGLDSAETRQAQLCAQSKTKGIDKCQSFCYSTAWPGLETLPIIYHSTEESMAKAEIHSGICGFSATVEARMNGPTCALSIESDCDAIQRLAEELIEVEPFQEITFRDRGPRTLELGAKRCYHTACPVPIGIIKAIEVEAGLALPGDATIKLSKSDK